MLQEKAKPDVTAPKFPTSRALTRTGGRAAALAAAVLIGAPLVSAAPATAEEGNTFLRTEQEVFDLISKSAPLNQREAVRGYPAQGMDSAEVALDTVAAVYSPEQALNDASATLGSGFDLDPNLPSEGPDIRADNGDDREPWLDGWDAKSMCGQPSHRPGGHPMPCGFVGVLDTAYPVMQTSAAVMGKAQFSYKTGATVGQDTTQTSGWSIGGKVTSELSTPGGPGGGKAGTELNFTYSQSTSTTNRWTTMTEQTNTYDVPDGTSGWIEGRANGGTYSGYIVYKLDFVNAGGEERQKMVLIPARVLIQAPTHPAPMTFVKRTG
ncbi:hypothetical protein OV450_8239 [Actinobacteria bacterium OV450]|nr:hypothetical protein OV450_8239 [Actinobacteria bacterium OV450]